MPLSSLSALSLLCCVDDQFINLSSWQRWDGRYISFSNPKILFSTRKYPYPLTCGSFLACFRVDCKPVVFFALFYHINACSLQTKRTSVKTESETGFMRHTFQHHTSISQGLHDRKTRGKETVLQSSFRERRAEQGNGMKKYWAKKKARRRASSPVSLFFFSPTIIHTILDAFAHFSERLARKG